MNDAIQGRSTDGVVDDVEALAIGMQAYIAFDILGAVVDGGCAQFANEVLTAGRAGGVDLGATGLGDLHGHLADTARAAVDQYLLALPDIGTVNQPFPSGDEDQWQRRRFTHAQCLGLERNQAGIDDDVFSQGTLDAADSASHPEYLIAKGEIVHTFPQLNHCAGQVDAQYGGQWLRA